MVMTHLQWCTPTPTPNHTCDAHPVMQATVMHTYGDDTPTVMQATVMHTYGDDTPTVMHTHTYSKARLL